jgi:hypothetical protein
MAEGGIDRKADERMEFTTSKDVTVAPTFTDSMLLRTRFLSIRREFSTRWHISKGPCLEHLTLRLPSAFLFVPH